MEEEPNSTSELVEREAEEHFRQKQLKLDLEREKLIRNGQIIEEVIKCGKLPINGLI